jgi:hypothetical protein
MGGMSHDPLCEWLTAQCTVETCDALRMGDHCEHEWCQCELIAKVRADQIERDAAVVKDFGWSPETDDADIVQVVADLREALNP